MLEIQVPVAEAHDVAALLDSVGARVATIETRNFSGADIASLVVALTPQILSFLAGLYVARTAAKKHVVFRSRGFEVRGVSEETLQRLYEAEFKRRSPET